MSEFFKGKIAGLWLSLGIFVLVSCSPNQSEVTLTKENLRDNSGFIPALEFPSLSSENQRFSTFIKEMPSLPTRGPDGTEMSSPIVSGASNTWTRVPSEGGMGMKFCHYRFGKDGKGEVYVSALPGGGGGFVNNVNRWRNQMGLDPISNEEAMLLPPDVILLDQRVPLIDLKGTYTTRGGETFEDYRMLGALIVDPQILVSAKMVGPAKAVAEEEINFRRYCQSIAIKSMNAPPR